MNAYFIFAVIPWLGSIVFTNFVKYLLQVDLKGVFIRWWSIYTELFYLFYFWDAPAPLFMFGYAFPFKSLLLTSVFVLLLIIMNSISEDNSCHHTYIHCNISLHLFPICKFQFWLVRQPQSIPISFPLIFMSFYTKIKFCFPMTSNAFLYF